MKHGLTQTRLYEIFQNMKQRCYNPKNPKYETYGGKGITICGEWLENFQAFYDWAIQNGYEDNLTIDRINSKIGYMPDNCRWVTWEENRKWSGNPKNIRLEIRLAQSENEMLEECARKLNTTKTEVIVKGISLISKKN